MSTDRFINKDGTLAINTFAGSIHSEHADTRMMVQITARDTYVQITMDEWIDLICFIRKMDREGKGITSYEA